MPLNHLLYRKKNSASKYFEHHTPLILFMKIRGQLWWLSKKTISPMLKTKKSTEVCGCEW